MGVSVDNEEQRGRIDHLRNVPVIVRFLSLEPLLRDVGRLNLTNIHWVIVGGESGGKARPIDADWVRSIREQCEASEVPFFFKQWGGVRKGEAGRVLDGKTWDGMPAATGRTGLNLRAATS